MCSGVNEEEFVVLLVHAGIVESLEATNCDCVERTQLIEWLCKDGSPLFEVLCKQTTNAIGQSLEATGADEPAANEVAIQRLIDHLVNKRWITPIFVECIDEVSDCVLYSLRMSSTEAYQLYLDKGTDQTPTAWSPTNTTTTTTISSSNTTATTDPVNSGFSSTQSSSSRSSSSLQSPFVRAKDVREQWFADNFPCCNESAKYLFFALKKPTLILYATLGLEMISARQHTVASFSRELHRMELSSKERSILVNFLAKSFPRDTNFES